MGNLARPIGSPATSHGARKNLNFVAPEAEVDELISNLMCGCCDALLVPPLNQIPSRWVKVMIIFSSPTPKQNRMHQRRTSESESRSCDGSTFAHDPLAYHVINLEPFPVKLSSPSSYRVVYERERELVEVGR